MNNGQLQAQINLLHNAETQAVQSMLLTALQHGFLLDELIKLAKKYQTNAALLEFHNGDCMVNYATAEGYFTRRFGLNYQQANDFAEQFDTWWCQ
ncbi:hypothetical protein BH012_09960 [Salmonella enterica]|nr:hypothetical protein [Salmonella enterica]EAX6601646.1 hypothetical protein [Salmonella enterica]